jgi:hypothetical protein
LQGTLCAYYRRVGSTSFCPQCVTLSPCSVLHGLDAPRSVARHTSMHYCKGAAHRHCLSSLSTSRGQTPPLTRWASITVLPQQFVGRLAHQDGLTDRSWMDGSQATQPSRREPFSNRPDMPTPGNAPQCWASAQASQRWPLSCRCCSARQCTSRYHTTANPNWASPRRPDLIGAPTIVPRPPPAISAPAPQISPSKAASMPSTVHRRRFLAADVVPVTPPRASWSRPPASATEPLPGDAMITLQTGRIRASLST